MAKRSLLSFLTLSREPKPTRPLCEEKGCSQEGHYKAPKKQGDGAYHYFCLEHVQRYNALWDYYRGMSDDEVEQSRKADLTWNRPTWPFRKGAMKSQFFFTQASSPRQRASVKMKVTVSKEVREALGVLKLQLPLTPAALKQRYRSLAKRYHPDLGANKTIVKDAEEKLKRINHAYATLRSFLTGNMEEK